MEEGPLPKHLQYLLRREDPAKLLAFFRGLLEGLSAACADSAKRVPAARKDRPGVYTRGNMRRWFMHKAFQQAAEQAGIPVVENTNSTGSWNFPVIRLGAFSLTVGISDRQYTAAPPRLRSRGQYVRELVARNKSLNPVLDMFSKRGERLPTVIPNGAFGAVVVVEPSLWVPDTPSYVGLLVPSPDLRRNYFRCSLESLIRRLRAEVAATKKPQRVPPKRKQVGLKRKQPKRPQG